MVGQRLKNYIQSHGLQADQVPKVVGVFMVAKYATLGTFIVVGVKYRPLQRLFPRRRKLSAFERLKQVIRDPWLALQQRDKVEMERLKQKWGGWYMWTAEKYWYLSDKLQASAHSSRAWAFLMRQVGGNPSKLALGVAEGTILCKVSVFLWAPPELWMIIRLFQTGEVSSTASDSGGLIERHSEAMYALEPEE